MHHNDHIVKSSPLMEGFGENLLFSHLIFTHFGNNPGEIQGAGVLSSKIDMKMLEDCTELQVLRFELVFNRAAHFENLLNEWFFSYFHSDFSDGSGFSAY
jgi:hypothetical protein